MAEDKCWEVLRGHEAKLGLSHSFTMRTIERLAHMLWMQEQHDKAETVVARILTKSGELPKPLQADTDDRRKYEALEMLYTKANSVRSLNHLVSMSTSWKLRNASHLFTLSNVSIEKLKAL